MRYIFFIEEKEGDKIPHDYALARVRAQRLLNAIFNPTNFDAIMNAITANPPSKTAFDTACGNINLTQEETDWLWNYLKHYSATLWTPSNVRDIPNNLVAAASTGW